MTLTIPRTRPLGVTHDEYGRTGSYWFIFAFDKPNDAVDRDVQRKSGPPHNPQALEARAPKAIDEGALPYSLEGPCPLIYGFGAPSP